MFIATVTLKTSLGELYRTCVGTPWHGFLVVGDVDSPTSHDSLSVCLEGDSFLASLQDGPCLEVQIRVASLPLSESGEREVVFDETLSALPAEERVYRLPKSLRVHLHLSSLDAPPRFTATLLLSD